MAVLWAGTFFVLGASAPEEHTCAVACGESAWIAQHRPPRKKGFNGAGAVLAMLREPSVWGIVLAHCALSYWLNVLISWTPTFFVQRFEVDIATCPHLLALPFLAGAAGGFLLGRVTD